MPDNDTQNTIDGPVVLPAEPLQQVSAQCPRMRDRWIIRPQPQGWTSPPISEWELSAAGFSDYHPHDEIVLILDGELHIEAEGHTVVARTGDTVRVPAGSTGRYWAPEHARMISIYGPNPEGADSEILGYWEIDELTET